MVITQPKVPLPHSHIVTLKDGREITVTVSRGDHDDIWVEAELAGEYLGGGVFYSNEICEWVPDKDTWTATSMFVNEDYRRMGVATAIYDAMERVGLKVLPELRHHKQSPAARVFWATRKKKTNR